MQLRVFVILLISLITLNGCIVSGTRQAKRKAARHLGKSLKHLDKAKKLDPSIIALSKTDTIVKEVVVEGVRTDTVFKNTKDTVRIEKEKLKIKYVKLPGDSVYIEGECAPDTIKVIETHTVETAIKRESYKDIIKRLLGIGNVAFYLLHIGLGIGFLLWLYISIIKPRFL